MSIAKRDIFPDRYETFSRTAFSIYIITFILTKETPIQGQYDWSTTRMTGIEMSFIQ